MLWRRLCLRSAMILGGLVLFSIAAANASKGLSLDFGVFSEDRESRPQKFENGGTLYSGDGYQLFFKPNQPCYIYIFQIDAAGNLFRLYPNPEYGSQDNFVQANREYWVPSHDKWFELDDTRGTELIYVIAARERRNDIEDIFARYLRAAQAGIHNQAEKVKEFTIYMKKMGVRRVRPGKNVQVTGRHGQKATLGTVELQLEQEGVSMVHKFTFEHK